MIAWGRGEDPAATRAARRTRDLAMSERPAGETSTVNLYNAFFWYAYPAQFEHFFYTFLPTNPLVARGRRFMRSPLSICNAFLELFLVKRDEQCKDV